MKKLSKQSGAVLLVFMLVLIVGSSYMLVTSLNANVVTQIDSEETYSVLNQAKQALIAYALTVPETSATIIPELAVLTGPGYLPCPDTDNDGNADCGAGAVVGRLPYITLGEEALVDGSGASLWYALDANYMDLGPPAAFLNSETVGQLSIDGQGDIVAIIFAPGNSLTGQQRELAVNNIANYLENDNQTNGDNSFVSALPGVDPNILIATFNDAVIALTRQELMGVVEKRVLSEVAQSLENYRNSFGAGNEAYPWLAVFANPAPALPLVNTFIGVPGTSSGHIPVHIPAQTYPNVSPFTVNWSGLPVAAPITTGIPPSAACLSDANCIDLFLNVRNVVTPLINVTCIWQNRYSFNCTGTDNGVTSPGLIRTYTTVYVDNGANNPTYNLPTAALPRSRNITVNGNLAGNLTITISDTGANVGSTSFTFPAGTALTSLTISGVDYHIDANGVDLTADGDVNDAGEQGDFPDWFLNNNWHHQVYVAYPAVAVEPLPGSFNALAPAPGPGVCNPNNLPLSNCLTLTSNGLNPINNNIRAIAVIAGQDLTFGDRPNGNGIPVPGVLTDYFDQINSDGVPNTFDRQILSTLFNDQVRVIRTVTTP